MNKQNVVSTHSGIFSSLKKETNSEARYDTEETRGQPETKRQIQCDAPYVRFLQQPDSEGPTVEWRAPGAGGRVGRRGFV